MTEDGYFYRQAIIATAISGEQIGERRMGPEGPLLSSRLQAEPLPKPFPLPGTTFSLDFHEVHFGAPQLPRADVSECIMEIRREMLQHIGRHFSGPISSLGFKISNIDLELVSTHDQTPLRYHDFVGILFVMSNRMSREGYYERFADIITSGTGEVLGDVQIFREHFGRPRLDLKSKASK